MTTSKVYLHHRSNLGEFRLASDGAIQTFAMWPRASMKAITEQIPEQEHDDYRTLAYAVGGFIVFPGNRIDGQQSINQAHGWDPDRWVMAFVCRRCMSGS